MILWLAVSPTLLKTHEPVTEDEAPEIAAERASLKRGEGFPNENVLADFGLSLEDFYRREA